ncbi:SLC13 family permease [Acholeplasma laidlawii]|uniref:SLC13 family permease n=1 Tax=Acholeplasma laidlawii TaxID=2148 RepID=UPI0025426792|nr:ArsB/NhaD family transporter [Acholeplasma laidlawii]
MALTLIIFSLTVVILILMVMFKPKLYFGNFSIESFWLVAVIGALFLVIFQQVSPNEIYQSLTRSTGMNPIKLLIIFISMSGLSVMLDELGFFKKVSVLVLKAAGTSQLKIFIYLYMTVSFLTIFTSNDIIILTFTPIIIYFSKHAKINPIPYLLSEFVAANTWSLMFMIGNPTNIYLASAFDITFFEYFKVMFIPTIAAGTFTFLVLWLLFNKDLRKPIDKTILDNVALDRPVLVWVTLINLILATTFLTISSYIAIEMYLIALCFLLFNTSFMVFYQVLILREYPAYFLNAVKRMPWNLMPFVISMFIMVISLNKYGVTENIEAMLSNLDSLYGYGLTSFISANFLNNIPMSVLFADIIQHMPLLPQEELNRAIYSSIIGSNIGAYLTPIGALAGMMWMRILKKEEIDLSFGKFISYGALISIPTMLIVLAVLQLFI